MNINLLPKFYQKNNRAPLTNPKLVSTIIVVLLGFLVLSTITPGMGNTAKQTEIQADNNLWNVSEDMQKAIKALSETPERNDFVRIIYGLDSSQAEIENNLKRDIKRISEQKAFLPSLEVVRKHENTIRSVARNKGVPEDVAIGIAFLENGGSETARSVAGAVGIYQLMPGTAKSLGIDPSERLNPQKNIEAGLTYLSNNYRRFGDWGLAIWSYHAGEGNVCRAIQIYAESNGVNLGNCLANPADVRNFVAHQGLNVHKLLSRPNVQSRLTNKLNDDSSGYPYKVLATAHLFGLAKNLPHNEFINRIALLNSQNMGLQDFFRS